MFKLNECIDEIRNALNLKGYIVLKNFVPTKDIEAMKNHWLSQITKSKKSSEFMRGEIFFGQKNTLTYENSKELCLYRNFEFLWNKADSEITRRYCIEIHKLRNLIAGVSENDGLIIHDDKYGIYISTSLYESEKGVFFKHRDGHPGRQILHFMMPLTFKGIDYAEGGLYLTNSSGEVDVDALCVPGDLILFDGSFEHEVKLIKGGSTGRLAVFAVPTHFIDGLGLKFYQHNFNKNFRKIIKKMINLFKNEK